MVWVSWFWYLLIYVHFILSFVYYPWFANRYYVRFERGNFCQLLPICILKLISLYIWLLCAFKSDHIKWSDFFPLFLYQCLPLKLKPVNLTEEPVQETLYAAMTALPEKKPAEFQCNLYTALCCVHSDGKSSKRCASMSINTNTNMWGQTLMSIYGTAWNTKVFDGCEVRACRGLVMRDGRTKQS